MYTFVCFRMQAAINVRSKLEKEDFFFFFFNLAFNTSFDRIKNK